MDERKRGRGFYIFICTLLILLITAITAASLFMLIPSSKNPLKAPKNGIGVESLITAQKGWIDGGMKTSLLAVAVSRGWNASPEAFEEKVALLYFTSENAVAEVTLLRNSDTGELAFLDQNGRTVTHNQKYLLYLLDNSSLYRIFCKTSPVPIQVMNADVDAYTYDYRGTSLSGEPLRFVQDTGDEQQKIPEFTTDDENLQVEGIPTAARVTIYTDDEQEQVFSGKASTLSSFRPLSHTPYLYVIETADEDGNIAEYRFIVIYHIKPTFSVSHTNLLTGGSFVISIDGVKENDRIECHLSFDYKPYFIVNGSRAMALVPVSHVLKTGEYSAYVSCGDYEETFTFMIYEDKYETQNLEISGEGASANNAEASKEYADTMYPLFDMADPNTYWDGLFIQPVAGEVTTPYGVYRYTNGSEYATRHAGVDIACAEGTGIVAANAGKILFSGFLELSGNTILIEHGMGLHTLYMHMDSLRVETGDFVEKGQLIGTVGSTGYSTGPHLHYQMMIMGSSINPWFSQDGRAGFFAASDFMP